jgi:SAM-dependent methyltransferase
MQALEHYKSSAPRDAPKWASGKSIELFFHKNKQLLHFLPDVIPVLVDIGCGSGADMAAISTHSKVGRRVCIDIRDQRIMSLDAEFIEVLPENTSIDLDTSCADVVLLFHSIHHMQGPITSRIREISRILRPGGIVIVKDHDVTNSREAANVDFEHAVYMTREWDGLLSILLSDFGSIEPMYYYSIDEINCLMKSEGLELEWAGIVSPRTYIYAAVYRKKNK